jgi:hypothetical protein
MESLENRALMAVVSSMPEVAAVSPMQVTAGPTIQLCSCSDTGVKGDGITSSTTPRFTGTAAPLATVTLAVEGGETLGTVRANRRGAFSFVSRLVIPEGTQVIRVSEAGSGGTGSTTVTFDRQKPKVLSIGFTGLDSFRVTFDRPVTGFTDRLRGLYFSGQPTDEPRFSLPFTSARLRQHVGRIEFTPSSDGRTYDIRMPELPIQSGKFQLRLNAAQSGVVDAVNGNRLALNAPSAEQTVA